MKTLVALNNDPTTGFSENLRVLHATPYPGNAKQWELDEPITTVVQNVEKLKPVQAQKQTIVRAIRDTVDPTVSIVKRKNAYQYFFQPPRSQIRQTDTMSCIGVPCNFNIMVVITNDKCTN